MSGRKRKNPLETLIVDAIEAADGDELSVGDLLDTFGTRSFGPLIAVIAFIDITPVAAIPFLPMLLAALILLISVQLLFGKTHPWVPAAIRNRTVRTERIETARDSMSKWLKRIDRLITPRLEWAANDRAQWLAALCVSILAIVMGAPPLELIPYATAVPAAVILLFGLGLTARDGLLMLLGFAGTGIAIWLAAGWIFGGGNGG
ncbi:MAG: exopolysaccharide biosynthesis protein [Pacificimonas sp.]